MDGLLPFVGTRPVPAGIGSLDPPKNSGLLLETVAQRPDQGAGADEARHPPIPIGRFFARCKPGKYLQALAYLVE